MDQSKTPGWGLTFLHATSMSHSRYIAAGGGRRLSNPAFHPTWGATDKENSFADGVALCNVVKPSSFAS
jgi:hypothetical protein